MRLFHILLLCCAIAEATSTMHFTDSWDGIVAGQPFDLTWEDNIGAVNITLNEGTETNCTAVYIIATNINSTSFTWTPTPAMPDNTFFFTLTDSTGTTAIGAEFVIATNPSTSTPTPAPNSSTTILDSKTTNSSITGSSTNSSPTTPDPEDIKAHKEELKRMKIGLGVGGSLVVLGLLIMPLFIAFLYWQGSTHTHAPHDEPVHVVVGHVV